MWKWSRKEWEPDNELSFGECKDTNREDTPQTLISWYSWQHPGPAVHYVKPSNEIYLDHLLRKCKGYPLWVPQANRNLPTPYRAIGVHIGDVGFFTPPGVFDYLFNICHSADHPINQVPLPDGFVPFAPFNQHHVREYTAYPPGSYLASSLASKSGADNSYVNSLKSLKNA